MKARVKNTGEVVEVTFQEEKSTWEKLSFYNTDDGRSFTSRELLFEESIDWEQRRFDLVKASLSGLMANSYFSNHSYESISEIAVKQADAVLTEYRKGGEQ